MNYIRKVVLFLIMLFLIVPGSTVYAQEDEPVTDQVLSIIVKKTETKNIVKEFISSDTSLPDSTSIPGLIISYDESNDSFEIKVNKTVELKGYLLDDNLDPSLKGGSLIRSTCNVKIVGDGTLNMTVISNPSSTYDAYDPEYFDYAFIKACDFEGGSKKVYVGDEDNGPTINMNFKKTKGDDKFYTAISGIQAEFYIINNSKINYNAMGYVFCGIGGEIEDFTGDRVYINKSELNIKYKKMNGPSNSFGIYITLDPCMNGNFTLIDSKLSFNNTFMNEGELADRALIFYGEKFVVNFINSKVSFTDKYGNYAFVHSDTLNIIDSTLNINSSNVKDNVYYIFHVRKLNIKDTNFDVKIAHGFVWIENDDAIVEIIESSDKYTGIIDVTTKNPCYMFVANERGDVATDHLVRIVTKDKSILQATGIKPSDIITLDDGTHIFIFDPENGDNPDEKILWKYMRISKPEKKQPEKHVVLNTGINK